MKVKKLLITLGLTCVAATCFAEGSLPLFTITSNLNPVSVRSDSEAVVRYTVRNNASVPLTRVTLSLGSNTTGVSIQSLDNSCASGSIAAHDTCNFNVLINGATPPTSVSPIVCTGNGAMCSTVSSANVLAVNQLKVSAAHAYLPILNSLGDDVNNANTVVPVNIAFPYQPGAGISVSDPEFFFSGQGDYWLRGAIAVSQDGQYIYVVDTGHNRLVILKSENGGVAQQVGVIGLAGDGQVTAVLTAIAVNLADTRAYVVDTGHHIVDIIDVSNKTAPILLEGSVSICTPPSSGAISSEPIPNSFAIAVSPDGSTAYVSCMGTGRTVSTAGNGSIDVINTSNRHRIHTISDQYQPVGLVVSPDGSTVYVANNSADYGGVSSFSTPNGDLTTFVDAPDDSYPFGIAISPDGSHIYYTDNNSDTVNLVNTSDRSTVSVGGVNSVFTNPLGIAVSPDGNKLFVTQGENTPGLVVVNLDNNNSLSSNINLNGYSAAFANFIG